LVGPGRDDELADTLSKESGQDGITVSGMSEGTGASAVIWADGGQAGIAFSVGGSGGQMSVSAGGAVSFSSLGGHVLPEASPATALGVSVTAAVVGSASVSWAASFTPGTV
jgi:hypothetical protein